MKNSTVEFAVHAVGDRIGVAVAGKLGRDDNGEFCELAPTDVHPNEGFQVIFRLGWRSAEAAVIFGPFSAGLIARMGQADADARQTVATFVAAVVTKRVNVLMRVNGSEVSPLQPDSWPKEWSKLELLLRLTPFLVDTEDAPQHERLILDLVIPLFGMIVALIGTEENELVTAGELEGEATQVKSTRYERSRLNREACVQLKGSRCAICGFDFAEVYGPVGVGYIQVHHLKTAASLGANYRVNIAKDLEPVCANCHAMMHRENPPITPERLRLLIEERRSKKLS